MDIIYIFRILNVLTFQILHYGADLFFEEPILIEFNLTNDGVIIIGNLSGSIHSLLRAFDKFGLPPIKRYLFLGQ